MKPDKLESYSRLNAKMSEVRPLHSILPLLTPYSILIDPSNKCNFKCTFCPTGYPEVLESVARPLGTMDYELFSKIIADIKEIVLSTGKKVKKLHLYKDGEPLINKNLSKMVKLAVDSDIAEHIETTTNGSMLTREIAIELIEAGLDIMRISVEGVSDADYKKITQTYSDYEKIKRNVAALFDENEKRGNPLTIHSKIVDTGLTDEEKERFISDFEPISTTINIDNIMGWSNSGVKDWTLGLDVEKGIDGVSTIKDRLICPEPFTKPAINFDGKVSACCVDWSYGTIIGDLSDESFTDIWHGERLKQFRLTHIKGEREKIPACKNCKYLLGLPDFSMLDDHKGALLEIYS